MKKGFLLTLVVVLTMVSTSMFAYSPVIGDIPDIVIGDDGDIDDLFRFSDAFVFDNYVTDDDTTDVSQLKWSFVDPADEIVINGIRTETGDPKFPTADLRAISETATFLSEVATTPAQNVITFFASDEQTDPGQKSIVVYTVDGAEDGYSVLTGVDPYWETDFATQGSWNFFNGATSAVGPTAIGSYDAANQRLRITTPAGNTTWYFWGSPGTMQITYEDNNVYVVRTNLSASANAGVPAIRMRAADIMSAKYVAMTTYGAPGGNGTIAGCPSTTAADFDMIFEPQTAAEDGYIAIDVYDASAGTGATVYVNSMKVYKFPVSAVTFNEILSTTPDTTWGPMGATSKVNITATQATISDITDAEVYANAGKGFSLPTHVSAGKVYRLGYMISSTVATPTAMDQVRMRLNEATNNAYSAQFLITNNYTSINKINGTPSEYYCWYRAANGPTNLGGIDYDFIAGLDYIALPGNAGQGVVLTGFKVSEATIPQLND